MNTIAFQELSVSDLYAIDGGKWTVQDTLDTIYGIGAAAASAAPYTGPAAPTMGAIGLILMGGATIATGLWRSGN